MATVIITGGTGLIGSKLTGMLLQLQHEVIIFSTRKNINSKNPQVRYVYWNPAAKMIDPSFSVENCIIINLAGAGVADKRWTAARKTEIIESRVHSLQTLYQAIESKQIGAGRLISASAIGYYATGDQWITEDAASDNSFLSVTCALWEAEARKFNGLGVDTAVVRVGIVLSKDGGALAEFLKTLQFGIAGIPGNGQQMMSWIHIEDVCRIFLHLIKNPSNDVYNAVADDPVSTNKLFDTILQFKKGIKVHIPSFLLKVILGEMSIEITKSAHISNAKIRAFGFDCKYPTIDQALADLLK
jgi:uncharacterized protein (TIGR01777 family)